MKQWLFIAFFFFSFHCIQKRDIEEGRNGEERKRKRDRKDIYRREKIFKGKGTIIKKERNAKRRKWRKEGRKVTSQKKL